MQNAVLEDSEFAALEGKDADEVAPLLSQMWSSPDIKPRLQSHRLVCGFATRYDAPAEPVVDHNDYGAQQVPEASLVGSAPPMQVTAAQLARDSAAYSSYTAPAGLSVSTAPGGTSASQPSPSAGSALSLEQLIDLRKKYDDMVTLTVRQRASLQDLTSRLRDKEDELEALRQEAATLREQALLASTGQTGAGATDLRRRRGQSSAEDAAEATGAPASGLTPAPPASSGGIPLSLVFLVAVLMFLLGRFLVKV